MIRWHIIRTAPTREFASVNRLKREGLASFVPIETKLVKRKASKERRNYPILTRYVFIGCEDIRSVWGKLREDFDVYPKLMHGVLGLNRALPYALSDAEVSYLASLSENPVPYIKSINPHRAAIIVREGQMARPMGGAFHGHEVRVSRIVGKKAHALVSLFGSMREVEFSLEVLEAV
jgi:transcription antitermination factor NusG